MRKTEEEQGTKVLYTIASVLLGSVLALVIAFVFLLICSILISGGWLKEGSMTPLTIGSCVIGSLFGGALAVKRCKTRTLVIGLCTGGAFFLILLTVSVFFYRNAAPDTGALGLLGGSLCGGALSGLMGGGKTKKKRRR
jgi:putative membrane protein (TIGR04086 family)